MLLYNHHYMEILKELSSYHPYTHHLYSTINILLSCFITYLSIFSFILCFKGKNSYLKTAFSYNFLKDICICIGKDLERFI